jgi:hypothetical protein
VKILNDYTIKIIIIVCRTTTIKMQNINTIIIKIICENNLLQNIDATKMAEITSFKCYYLGSII